MIQEISMIKAGCDTCYMQEVVIQVLYKYRRL